MAKFFWGASTSAYQVEGGNHNNWSEWEHERGLELSGRACDHYSRFREDFDIAKSLGHNAHRFSIEWSRIEPEKEKFNEKEIQHYREVIRALKERGIEPFITLWHWTTPLWFRDEGDWLNPRSPEYFARFVERMAREFPEVTYWITLNETNVYTVLAYVKGRRPTSQKSLRKYFLANKNLVLAHKAAHNAIKKVNKDAIVGIAENQVFFEAYGRNPWNHVLKAVLDYFWNRRFLDNIKGELDFLGINYYFHNRINWKTNQNENKEISDMRWEIYPEGLYRVLTDAGYRYRKPIYITENGIADRTDSKRAKFIKEHIDQMHKAMASGVDVRGYLYWSLLDNFEWDDGFAPRFGLVEMDYKTMERRIRPSAWEYKKIIESS